MVCTIVIGAHQARFAPEAEHARLSRRGEDGLQMTLTDLAELREKHSWGTLTRKTEKPRARDPRRAALGIPEKRTRRKRRVRANGPLTSPDLASGQWPRRIHSGLKS